MATVFDVFIGSFRRSNKIAEGTVFDELGTIALCCNVENDSNFSPYYVNMIGMLA